ncbi:DUF1203 domain-containing protein [Bernardetia sp. OM2101]|uniref:DUF1203 domain-containing protein n=1 Tax=Bernardetia sp. OM2101 TaxID=3344876 RepID=UPI0035CEBD68
MNTNFKISAITDDYNHLFALNEQELSSKGMVRMVVDKKPGYPCRISLKDAEVGEEVILLPFKHHRVNSPYQSSGPIFIRKNAKKLNIDNNVIPKMLLHRLLSLRIYNKNGIMIDAKIIEGKELKNEIKSIFENRSANYIQIHNASPGCYNCQVNRVG